MIFFFLNCIHEIKEQSAHGLPGDIPSLQRRLSIQVQIWLCLTAPGVTLGPVIPYFHCDIHEASFKEIIEMLTIV